MALALEGIRILDLTWLGPGVFCSTTFGDLGADVIEVYEAHPERRGAPYTMLYDGTRPGMRNCRTIGIDLKSQAGRDVLYDLVKTADVVMEGFRPGVAQRLGADYDTVKRINPRIVYASQQAARIRHAWLPYRPTASARRQGSHLLRRSNGYESRLQRAHRNGDWAGDDSEGSVRGHDADTAP